MIDPGCGREVFRFRRDSPQLLTVLISDEAIVHTLDIPSELPAAREAELRVLDELKKHTYDETATFAVKLALEESLNNAIKHGNGYDPSKKIRVEFDVDSRRVAITVTDEGGGFDPASIPDPRTDENLEKPSGRGIMLIKAYMDDVRFNERGNQVHMVKRNR